MPEIELKLQIPAGRERAVRARFARAGRIRLRACYFDTPEGALAAAGLALRLRHEGRGGWVQTLKGAGADPMTRHEHDVPLGGSAARMPAVDPLLHRGTEVGERLRGLLEKSGRAARAQVLAARYGTDVTRLVRRVRHAGSSIEAVLDKGEILAGEARWPLGELELELKSGDPGAVVAVARGWIDREGLWLDTRSKAERGSLLAAGRRVAAAAGATVVTLDRHASGEHAWRDVVRACAAQITANASQIAAGEHAPEHVHQLRVGIRRLRSAERLFDRQVADPLHAPAARELFVHLGNARDADLQGGVMAAAAERASAVLGARPAPRPVEGAADNLCDILRRPAVQHWLLDVVAACVQTDASEPAAGADDGWVDALARRLNRWHREAAAAALRYRELDDAARHRLRKRIKRLRYAIEFSGALFARKPRERYLRRLRALQDRLGEINDLGIARQSLVEAATSDARAAFMAGSLDARRGALIEAAAPALERFAQAPRFWKTG